MRRNSGFTLIELMVVIGIMILIGSIVITGSFGMSRASGYMAAENIVYNTLQAAHQKACTDGRRVLVAFVKIEAESDDYALVTVEAAGTIEEIANSKVFYDKTSLLAANSDTRSDDSIWNLDTGVFVEGPFTNSVAEREFKAIPSDSDVGEFAYSTIKVELLEKKGEPRRTSFNDPPPWKAGHAYGFQVGEKQELPTGFKIGFNSVDGSLDKRLVVFEPDGRSFFGQQSGGGLGGGASDGTLFIYEEIDKDHPVKIKVRNGSIVVDKVK